MMYPNPGMLFWHSDTAACQVPTGSRSLWSLPHFIPSSVLYITATRSGIGKFVNSRFYHHTLQSGESYLASSLPCNMGSKRAHTALDSPSDENTPIDHSSKRRREHAPAKPKPAEARVDATYGQRAAFPGLDGPIDLDDDDLEYEDAGDALAYLKSVR